MLYDQTRHTPTCTTKWSEEKIRSVILDIFNRTVQNFDPINFWPKDPNEDTPVDILKSMYNGAAGILWALDKISVFLQKELPFEKANLIASIYEQYLITPDTESVVPSFFLGEVGILLIYYKFNPTSEIEDKLFHLSKKILKILRSKLFGQLLELCWVQLTCMSILKIKSGWTFI